MTLPLNLIISLVVVVVVVSVVAVVVVVVAEFFRFAFRDNVKADTCVESNCEKQHWPLSTCFQFSDNPWST